MDDFDLGEGGKELQALTKELSDLKIENGRLKQIIMDNDLEEEIEDIDCTSLEEKICIDGIRHISDLVETHQYDDKDVKNFDTLYRTLRTIRGKSATVKTKKVADIADLLKIVNEGE